MRKERKVRSGKIINSRLVKEGWYSRDPPQISLIHQTELSDTVSHLGASSQNTGEGPKLMLGNLYVLCHGQRIQHVLYDCCLN